LEIPVLVVEKFSMLHQVAELLLAVNPFLLFVNILKLRQLQGRVPGLTLVMPGLET
jgi:hypothetical protein